jgi:UDP-3-O-[3-hydroxymyristoyl] glucosamine N-acyltransferase
MKSYTIQEINDILKGEIIGNTSQSITAPEQLEAAESEISFIGNKKYENFGPTQSLCRCQRGY